MPCIVLMLSVGVVKCQVAKIGDQLPSELAKIKAMGIGTEPSDLERKPPVPDSENAALHYQRIFDATKRIAGERGSSEASLLSAYTGHPSDAVAYEAALMRYKPVFDLAAQLPRYSDYEPKRKYEDGFDLLFPEFAEMKTIVKRESSRTRFLLDKGRNRDALSAVEVQFAVSDHLSQERTLIGALVCIAIHAIASANLDQVLEAIQGDPQLLAEAEAMLMRHRKIPSFRWVMEGESILGRVSLRKIESAEAFQAMMYGADTPPTWDDLVDRFTLGDPSFRKMFEAKFVGAYRRLFEVLPKDEQDWPTLNAALEKFSKEIEADTTIANRLNQIMFPVFDQAGNAFAKMHAEQRVSLLAVKLLRMRPVGLPANLSQFGALAIDPLSGKPMGYVKKGDGFKVWSIGGDLHDDGGRKRGKGIAYADTDIVLGYRIGFPPVPRIPVNRPAGAPAGAPTVLGP